MTELVQEKLTDEEIQRHYNAAMDSVNLINAGKTARMSDEEWDDCLKRNKDHLKIMLAKTWWNDQDLTPLQEAAE